MSPSLLCGSSSFHLVILPVRIFVRFGSESIESVFCLFVISAIPSVAILISLGKSFFSLSVLISGWVSLRVLTASRTLSLISRLIASTSLVYSGMIPAAG